MGTIKIISNPYKKEVYFQKLDSDNQTWINIDFTTYPNSQLLGQDLSTGFLPFQAYRIVECILNEYGSDDEKIDIIFEGSDDEYKELEEVCSLEPFEGKVSLSESDIYLENARDILPEVRNLFTELSPLIHSSVTDKAKIARDLSRFSDASSDIVPICVLGNYSAGKSTFINALIGSEILPNGNEPVTAKIYEIKRSEYNDRAYIKFQINGLPVTISFTEQSYSFSADRLEDNELVAMLKDELKVLKQTDINSRLNKVLGILNSFEKDSESPSVSDLIEVKVPFIKGILADSQHPFVIFDTPGSNSASNARHLVVLKQAMADMTNGLPIFLSTPDSLDSTDNENLYNIIHGMDELDSRFTMIVVNKADDTGLRKTYNENEKNSILSQAVPRSLYSGGIYFVSSILGLGSKNKGEFVDDFYAEIFEDQENKYKDPSNRRYKTLYSYNIMPSQIKNRSDKLAAEQQDLVYANSGLFTIETEIENFAGKYSAYNKCFQSQMFLRRVIQITQEEIEKQEALIDDIRRNITDKLEQDKKNLIHELERCAEETLAHDYENYPRFMADFTDEEYHIFQAASIKGKLQSITEQYEKELGFKEATGEIQTSFANIGQNLKKNFKSSEKFGFDTIKTMAKGVFSDVASTGDAMSAKSDLRHKIDKLAGDDILKIVSEDCNRQMGASIDAINNKSISFWSGNTEALRNMLAAIVTGSEVLTEERRAELEKIIVTYDKIFNDKDDAFVLDKENFEIKIRFLDQVIWTANHIDVKKLAKTCNSRYSQAIVNCYGSVKESHYNSSKIWARTLLDMIIENIVEYSPELSRQAQQIQIMTQQIEDLQQRQIKIIEYTNNLCAMMDWKKG